MTWWPPADLAQDELWTRTPARGALLPARARLLAGVHSAAGLRGYVLAESLERGWHSGTQRKSPGGRAHLRDRLAGSGPVVLHSEQWSAGRRHRKPGVPREAGTGPRP